MKNNLAISLIVSSVILLGCTKSGGGGGKVEGKKSEPLETEMYGTYQAYLLPVNKTVSGHLNGTVALVREKEDLTIEVRLSGGPLSALHTQSIHIGDRCPTEADDLNGDGYVDGEEGALVYKEIIIPLDDDIGSQRMGLGSYPVSNEYGYYLWGRTTLFEKIMEDLREEDINLRDDYVKLESNKSLTMFGKVAVILGVPQTTVLPETVLGRGRMTSHQALPIACGVIRRLGTIPGQVDTDETGIPVPEGETIGGSSGVDDGAIFVPSETGGTTGNYGEEDEPTTTTNNTEHGTAAGATAGTTNGDILE
jgi:hypothetical protein